MQLRIKTYLGCEEGFALAIRILRYESSILPDYLGPCSRLLLPHLLHVWVLVLRWAPKEGLHQDDIKIWPRTREMGDAVGQLGECVGIKSRNLRPMLVLG